MTAATAASRRAAAAPARTAPPKARATPRARAATAGVARPRAATRRRRTARGPTLAPMPARLVPLAVGRTAVAVSGIADSGLVHRLTRGRLWIGALTTLLVGIVALNVLALSFNASSSRVGQQADGLKREISSLRARIAAGGASNERAEQAAAKLGLAVPEPGSIRYLHPSAGDAAAAARRLGSGELTAASYAAPAPASAPITSPTSPPATDQPAPATQPSQGAPAAPGGDTAGTTGTTSPQAPAAGGPTGGAASGSGGGVSSP